MVRKGCPSKRVVWDAMRRERHTSIDVGSCCVHRRAPSTLCTGRLAFGSASGTGTLRRGLWQQVVFDRGVVSRSSISLSEFWAASALSRTANSVGTNRWYGSG